MVTNAVGQYSASLRVGNYEISFLLPNFRPFTARGISLHVNDRLQVNGKLIVGAVETLTVSAERLTQPTPAVQTLIQQEAVRELPWPDDDVHAFVHGEAAAVKELRGYLRLERALGLDRLSISGYWRLGDDDEGWRAGKRDWNAAIEQSERGATGGLDARTGNRPSAIAR